MTEGSGIAKSRRAVQRIYQIIGQAFTGSKVAIR